MDHHDACVDITIPQVLPEALHCILDFLYCGTIGIPSGIRESVLEAANLLQIKNFTDYLPFSEKHASFYESDNITPQKNFNVYGIRTRETCIQKHERGAKGEDEGKYVQSSASRVPVQVKEESEADQKICAGTDALQGQRKRKVKSIYSTDLYEVNLPRARKYKKGKISRFLNTEKEAALQNTVRAEQSNMCQVTEKQSMPNVLSSLMDNEQKSNQNKLKKISTVGKASEDFTTTSTASVCEPMSSSSVALSFTEKESKALIPQLPITLASTSSSVIMSNIFVADQPYISDSATNPESLMEVSCVPAIAQEDSVALNGRSLEPPNVGDASLPPTSVLSGVKELTLMAPPPSMETSPTSPSYHKTSETFHGEKNEEEQDGVFKFQVWYKKHFFSF